MGMVLEGLSDPKNKKKLNKDAEIQTLSFKIQSYSFSPTLEYVDFELCGLLS